MSKFLREMFGDAAGAILILAIAAAAFGGAACLRTISATPGTTPDGRPSVEVCAELMAKATASPSGAPRAVATMDPSAKPQGGL